MRKLTGFILLFLLACNPDRVYEEYAGIDDYIWQAGEEKVFDVEIKNPGAYDVLFNVRNTGNYRWQNLWVSVEVVFPSGESKSFKTDLRLANKDGSWRGQGLGDIIDHRYLILDNLQIKEPGAYTFKIRQLMRDEALEGVMEVGVAVMRERE